MSATSGDLNDVPEFAKTIIQLYITGVTPSIEWLVLSTAYGALLIPLLFALFTSSTELSRRRPLFILVTFDVVLCIAVYVYTAFVQGRILTAPFDSAIMSHILAFTSLFTIVPWFIDLVLVMRLVAVYPPRTTTRLASICIFSFPVAIKIARLVLIILYNKEIAKHLKGNITNILNLHAIVSPYNKAEWILQIFDNGYLSIMFLAKLRGSFSVPGSLAARIRTLFWIAAGNFVFPVVFNIAQVVNAFSSSSIKTSAHLTMTNLCVTMIGVVFTTVWSNSNDPARRSEHLSQTNMMLTTFVQTGGSTTFDGTSGTHIIPCEGVKKTGSGNKPAYSNSDLHGAFPRRIVPMDEQLDDTKFASID